MTNNQNSFRQNEAGNILVYILGAIFLLGLLVVVVKGSSTPGAGIDQEQLLIRIAEVQEYGNELEQAVAWVLRNGHSEADIRFAHPDADSAYGDITDTPTRQIFHRDGGGATYREQPSGIQTTATPWVFNGSNVVGTIGSGSGAQDKKTDLIAILSNVSESFCLNINQKNDALTSSGANPQDCGAIEITNKFDGNFSFNNEIFDGSGCGGAELLAQELEGCIEGGGTPPAGTYHYYRVLLPR